MDSKTLALVASILIAFTSISSMNQTNEFDNYKLNLNKRYGSEIEEAYRQAIFNVNYAKMIAHNADETQTYTMAINQFSDWTQEEFESIMLTLKAVDVEFSEDDEDLAVEVGDVDWVSQGAVTAVQDQGACGSCWSFAAAAATEAARWHSGKSLKKFSEQQLVSCDKSNSACNGGVEFYGIDYYAQHGVCTESSYPYTSGSGSVASCKESSCSKDSFRPTGYKYISGTSTVTSNLKKRVMTTAVDASNWSSYGGGIFSNCSTRINHAVTLVGYTSSYWLVKNSWSQYWGESGYIRVKSGNTCAITSRVSYATY